MVELKLQTQLAEQTGTMPAQLSRLKGNAQRMVHALEDRQAAVAGDHHLMYMLEKRVNSGGARRTRDHDHPLNQLQHDPRPLTNLHASAHERGVRLSLLARTLNGWVRMPGWMCEQRCKC